VPSGSFSVFWSATTLADAELALGRWADALLHYGLAGRAVAVIGLPLGELIQAETIAVALAELGRLEDAATVHGVCDVARRELSAPMPPFVARARERVEAILDAGLRAQGLERATAMGMRAGLDWAGALARGEIA
jgi:hypothetical protein